MNIQQVYSNIITQVNFSANDILNMKPLTFDIYKNIGGYVMLNILGNLKIIPTKLAIIIKYHRDKELSHVVSQKDGMVDLRNDDVKRISEHYNEIVDFYDKDSFEKHRTYMSDEIFPCLDW